MIELTVTHSKTRVSGGAPMEIIRKPLHYVEKVFMTKKMRSKVAAISYRQGTNFNPNKPMLVDRYLYDEFDDSFPTGMLPQVIDILNEYNFAFTVNDLRGYPPEAITFGAPTGKYADKKPRQYQQDAIDNAIFSKRGIIQIACGGGKTLCAGEIIKNLRRRSVFLVNRSGLLTQAKEVFEQMLGGPVGQVGDGVVDIQDVNVVMIQTLVRHLGQDYEPFDDEDTEEDATDVAKYAKQIQDMLDGTHVLFLDECHCIGAKTAFDCVSAFKNAAWRLALSATPVREDGKDIFFEACFGKKLVRISFTFLIEQGFLVQPYISFLKLNGPQLNPHTSARYATIYKSGIVQNEYRNRLAGMQARLLAYDGHRPMILVQQVTHGELIASKMKEATFVHGVHSSKQRKVILSDFMGGKIPVLIATTIMDEAIDIPPCDCVIMAGGGASYVRTIQRMSRAMRIDENNPNKKYCIIVDFFDEDKYLRDHCYIRQTTYRSEKAFKVLLPNDPKPWEQGA